MYNNSEENINNETSVIVQEFLRYFTFDVLPDIHHFLLLLVHLHI